MGSRCRGTLSEPGSFCKACELPACACAVPACGLSEACWLAGQRSSEQQQWNDTTAQLRRHKVHYLSLRCKGAIARAVDADMAAYPHVSLLRALRLSAGASLWDAAPLTLL